MKRIIFVVLTMTLALMSCNKDDVNQENEIGGIDMNPVGMMADAGCITGMRLCCMEKEILWLLGFDIQAVYRHDYTDKGIEPVFDGYQSVRIYAEFDRNGNGLSNDERVDKGINNLVREYFNSRSGFIIDAYNNLQKPVQWPFFYTSYINGDVALTCDKVLFGHQPGDDLSSHFVVIPANSCLPVGWEQPHMQYSFGDADKLLDGICMADFFLKESWVQFEYLIKFSEIPQEQYDEVTLTLSLPVSREHVREYCTSAYNGENAPMHITNVTYTSSVKIKFDWK